MRPLLLALCLLLIVSPASACFGPKLYVGVGPDSGQRLFFELVALYVKEKTGTDVERVEVPDAETALAQLGKEKIDLAVVAADRRLDGPVLLKLPGLWQLPSGPRPLQDLQFTLVGPALKKLQRQLTPEIFQRLQKLAADGLPPAAAARKLLTELGWI